MSEDQIQYLEAIVSGDVEGVKRWLLAHGRPTSFTNNRPFFRKIEHLWKHESDYPLFDYFDYNSPLLLAIALGYTDLAMAMVSEFAYDPAAQLTGCGCSLHMAVLCNLEDLVCWLLMIPSVRTLINTPTKSYTSSYPLQIAAVKCYRSILLQLLVAGADPNAHILTGGGDTIAEMVFNRKEETSKLDRMWVVKVLVQHKAKVTDNLVIHIAKEEGENLCMTLKLIPHVQMNSKMMISAVREGLTVIASTLLAKGADPNTSDGNWTLLHHASRNPGGKLEMTKILLKFGANPNLTTNGGKKPSEMAFPEAKVVLLEAEAATRLSLPLTFKYASQLTMLHGMGFNDTQKCMRALEQFAGNVDQAVSLLL